MRWKYKDPRDWHRKFAWLPTLCGKTTVWLETYERQYVAFRFYRKRVLSRSRRVYYDNTDYGD